MSIKATFSGESELRATLQRLAERADSEAGMRSVSIALLRETERIFERQGQDVGLSHNWAPLSEVTKHRRALRQSGGRQRGKNGRELARYSRAASGMMRMLQDSGKLAASIQPVSGPHKAGVTTNRQYAATMFFGAKQGQFGRDSRNHPIPWGDIPARPFFPLKQEGSDYGLTEPAERSVLETLARFLES